MTYRQFLLQNAPVVAQIESTLRSISYLLPGRFKNADLASAALFSLVSLFSLYNDQFIHASPLAPKTCLNRYILDLLGRNKKLKRLAYMLRLTNVVDVVLEMAAGLRNEKFKDNVILGIEFSKYDIPLPSI